jgi:hypothetical protein
MNPARRLSMPRPSGPARRMSLKIQLLCAVALGFTASAGVACAQSQDTFSINTSVTPFCANLSATASLTLNELTGTDGKVLSTFANATSTTFTAPGYYCNAPARVTLAATPLMRTPAIFNPATDLFTQRVDYVAALSWQSVSGSVSSTATAPVEYFTTQPNAGALNVQVTNPTAELRPLAGTYAGSVTVTVALQP